MVTSEKTGISDLIDIQNLKLEFSAGNMDDTILEMVDLIYQNGYVDQDKRKRVCDELIAREYAGSTGIGDGFALPHARTKTVSDIVIAVAISSKGIDYNAINGKPVYLVFMILTPTEHSESMSKILREAATILSDKNIINSLRNAKNREDVMELLLPISPMAFG